MKVTCILDNYAVEAGKLVIESTDVDDRPSLPDGRINYSPLVKININGHVMIVNGNELIEAVTNAKSNFTVPPVSYSKYLGDF